ncbi:hypothetical protein FQN60_007617, partial [Etheostoma spectabile]
AKLEQTVLLVGRLIYIIGYYDDKNKAVTWEQITALGLPLVAAYWVSVPRLLHCPTQLECYQENKLFHGTVASRTPQNAIPAAKAAERCWLQGKSEKREPKWKEQLHVKITVDVREKKVFPCGITAVWM